MFRCRVPVVALFLMLAACGGGDNGNPASPSGNNGSGSGGLPACDDLRSGVFDATIDGSPWTAGKTLPLAGLVAESVTIVRRPAISIAGGSCDDTGLGFIFLAVVATRSVGDGSGTTGVYEENAASATPQQWNASVAGGSGTVTVLSVSATRVRGTFSFTLVPDTTTGATGTVRVTQGAFDVKLPCPPPSCADSQ